MEVFGAEKFIDGDIQAVAELFDRCDGRRVVSAAHNVIKRGLRDAAEDALAVDRDTSFFAQRQNAPPHGFAHCHHNHPAFFS